MRVALLHLELSMGPEEKNLSNLTNAIKLAGASGAKWILTPEVAVQGYYFNRINPDFVLEEEPSGKLGKVLEASAEYSATLFLGCAEYDAVCARNFNTCLIFDGRRNLLGRHRKLVASGGAEKWAAKGSMLKPVNCRAKKVGVMVCADAWYIEHAAELKEKGAELLIDIAAWPPTEICGNPIISWEKCSLVTGLPLWVCNQTGAAGWMDMTISESVVIEGGQTKLSYQGNPAILLFDWDEQENKLLSDQFEIIKYEEKFEFRGVKER